MKDKTFWSVHKTSKAPIFPKRLSYSSIKELDSCPLKYYYSHNERPGSDSHSNRYPQIVNVKTICGVIIHASINKIVRLLISKGCISTKDKKVFQVLKEIGGIINIVSKEINDQLIELKNNPRYFIQEEYYKKKITDQHEFIIQSIQYYFHKINFLSNLSEREKIANSKSTLGELRDGVFTEIFLDNNDYGLIGFVDLLSIYNGNCVITDFKTGSFKDSHIDQMKFYSMLWYIDQLYNPRKEIAKNFVLMYLDNELVFEGPSEAENLQLLSKIINKIGIIKKDFESGNVLARYDEEFCGFCQVRQLCSEFWKVTCSKVLELNLESGILCDVEVEILEVISEESFYVELRNNLKDIQGSKVVLRNTFDIWQLKEKDHIRILRANVYVQDQENLLRININHISELFWVT